jgi:hypothetical protein
VLFYIKDDRDSTTEYRFVRRVSPDDPEYFGLPFTTSAITDYPKQDLPIGNADNELVALDDYIVFGSPPQMIDIASQKPVTDGNRIEGLQILAVDNDRTERVRYQLAIFTNDYPLIAYFDVRIVDGELLFQIDMEKVGLPTGLKSRQSIFKRQRLLLYQGQKGIYSLNRKGIKMLISEHEYPQLSDAILSTAFNGRENELWFLLPDNECLVLSIDNKATTREMTNAPHVYAMRYPSEGAKVMRQLTQQATTLMGCADGTLLTLDGETSTDAGILKDESAAAITGVLTSDHLSGMQQQIYLDVIELLGMYYSARVYADLETARFDTGTVQWKSDFTKTLDSGKYDLSMKGLMLELASRGISPRLQVTLDAAAGGRFSGAELHYWPVKHEGAARF